MLPIKSARWLIALSCAVLAAGYGVFRFKQGHSPPSLPHQSVQPSQPAQSAQPQATPGPVLMETAQAQAPNTTPEKTTPSVEEHDLISPIVAFRRWAETAATAGQNNVDERRGMELAKARAADMKELIMKDPASALREALPADLRAALPAQIAAAIEQPVNGGGCSQ